MKGADAGRMDRPAGNTEDLFAYRAGTERARGGRNLRQGETWQRRPAGTPWYLATQRRNVVSGKCCVTCAKTSLPWFIGDPHDQSPRRVADSTLNVQIETRENHELSLSLRCVTGQQPVNVRTVVGAHKNGILAEALSDVTECQYLIFDLEVRRISIICIDALVP